MKPKKKQRTDDDFIRLDDAMRAIANWWAEIVEELAKKGYGESYLSQVNAAMQRVHSPEDKE